MSILGVIYKNVGFYLEGVCLDNETVWRDFNECNASFESLACWGHHLLYGSTLGTLNNDSAVK